MPPTPTIAFLRRGYSSTGGAEAYLLRLARGLQEQGFRIVLLGTGDWPRAEWPGEEMVTLSRSLSVFAKEALTYQEEKKCDLLFSMERVPGCDLFRAGDGVHAAWLDLRERKNLFSTKWWREHCSRHRHVLALERKLYDPSAKTHVIANSHMVADQIEDYFGFPQKKISIIPNGVPLSKPLSAIERQAVREHFNMSKEECVLLFVGSGWERKGLRVALKAVERLKESNPSAKIQLWIAGKGDARRYCSPHAHFLGPIKKIELLYAAADLFILPTRYDPFSNASLEALAAGLPVITTRFNGCSEIMQEGVHGSVLDDPTDVSTCAAALGKWYERLQRPSEVIIARDHCATLGAAFSVERNLKATTDLIFQVLEKQKGLVPNGAKLRKLLT
ncbi:MAG: glycosyltransferase family 4 protein [Chthoniobacterales bacterium]|nr:glycosyltransferase family 4 protein [Chthoniobacterales bacterium]